MYNKINLNDCSFNEITADNTTLEQQIACIENGHPVNPEYIITQAMQLTEMPLENFFGASDYDPEKLCDFIKLHRKIAKPPFTVGDALRRIPYGDKEQKQIHVDYPVTATSPYDVEITDAIAQIIMFCDPVYQYSGTAKKIFPIIDLTIDERSDE